MEQLAHTLPVIKPNAHVGILGGSFDPPHLCHQLLALSFLALEPIDELWVIPCLNHAVKQVSTDFAHRLAMCEIAFKRVQQVRVLDIESHLLAPNYTINTLNFILHAKPDLTLHLGIGSDLISDFHTWHKAEEITNKAQIVVFERTSYPLHSLPTILASARIHKGYALPDIRSTTLRDFFRHKNGQTYSFLDQCVARYIAQHHLYESNTF